MTIRRLSEHLINQIAAGEVIERPASVVKELVENSLDAGADHIEVELQGGGIERILVSDNGCGIPAPELGAALSRHWTSKLSDARGLDAIVSLGFRGEALASIAAVADIEVVSRTAGDRHAWSIAVEPGAPLPAPRPARGNPGSRVEVRGLFASVPARRRFLKQPRTEFLHVQRLLRHFAFARPEVTFVFSQPGTRGLRLRPAPYGVDAPRWRSLFGAAFVAAATPVAFDVDGVGVSGWVGAPTQATPHNDLQFIVLNGRVIRDRNLNHAVRAAYGERVAAGAHPVYALALTVAPGRVDVNVHPGKLEVRLADLRSVHDILHLAVRQALPAAAGAAATRLGEAMPRSYAPRVPGPARPLAQPAPATGPAARWSGRPLTLVAARYLFDEHDDRVRVFDLRACWKAVLTARIGTATAPRPLLIPERLAPATLAALAARPGLAELGFELADLGPAGGLLRAVPTVLPELDYAAFVTALAAAGGDDAAAVAAAAAGSLAGGHSGGHSGAPDRAQLDALARAAHAAGLDLATFGHNLDAATLAHWCGDG